MDELLINTYTKIQALKRLRIIKDFLNFRFFEHSNNDKFLEIFDKFKDQYLKINNPQLLKELESIQGLGEKFFDQFQPSSLHLQLETLEKSIEATKIISLHIPFEIPDSETERLGNWFKKNLGMQTLFELIYDPSLIGGCGISVNGMYKDYSLRNKISENNSRLREIILSFKQR